MTPHSLFVKTGEIVANGVATRVPRPVAGLSCTMRTSPVLRVTKSRPEPSGAHAIPVGEPRLALVMKVVSAKPGSTGAASARSESI